MDTYKYYIDFASRNDIEFIVLDEGWYNPKSGDMLSRCDPNESSRLIRLRKTERS